MTKSTFTHADDFFVAPDTREHDDLPPVQELLFGDETMNCFEASGFTLAQMNVIGKDDEPVRDSVGVIGMQIGPGGVFFYMSPTELRDLATKASELANMIEQFNIEIARANASIQ